MNTTLVLTAYDDRFEPLGRLTTPDKEKYAALHKCDFKLARSRPKGLAPLWWKQYLVADALAEYGAVIWMDADMMITNPEVDLEGLADGIHLSKDWGEDATEDGHFSCGAYFASFQALEVFDHCEIYQDRHPNAPFGDQDALRDSYRILPDLFRIHPRRMFNAVPIEVHPSVVEPWQPGDFLCHLTMLPLADRVDLFHEIKRQCN